VQARAAVALADELGDVAQVVAVKVELEDEVAYREYNDEGEADEDLLD
jgi:hypothetical protein